VGSAYLVMTALAVLIIILILSLVRLGNGTQKSRSADIPWRSDAPDPAEAGQQRRRPCPVCGTMIGKGESVHSVYYSKRGRSADGHRLPVEEIHTEVYGCPYCWPAKSEHPPYLPGVPENPVRRRVPGGPDLPQTRKERPCPRHRLHRMQAGSLVDFPFRITGGHNQRGVA
jgi:hypothetical protein